MKTDFKQWIFESLNKIERDPSLRQETIRKINHLLLFLLMLGVAFGSEASFLLMCISLPLFLILVRLEHR